jgi:hypothetical protein
MDRKVRLPLYVLVILIITSSAGPVGSTLLALALSRRTVAEVVEKDREQTCVEHGAVITAFRGAPLQPAGRALLATYEGLYAKNRCAEDPPGR